MEAVAIARHNWLGDKHNIGRLLKPHTIGTIFINFMARHSPFKNSSTLSSTSVGKNGALQLMSEEMSKRFSWFAEAFPRQMEERGFPRNKTDGLKGFYYRDDGFMLWDALHEYVEGVVRHTYPSDKAIEEDTSLKSFHASLHNPEEGNIRGFPKTPGNRNQLTETLTLMIFTASVQHQAVNAQQYTYSYQPHRPRRLTRWMPDDLKDITWKFIKDSLPSLELAKGIYRVVMFLSTPTKSLCNLLSLDTFKDDIPKVHEKLQSDLKHISFLVKKRGGEYNHLDPENVPCSVDV